jgi:hypothetical protein
MVVHSCSQWQENHEFEAIPVYTAEKRGGVIHPKVPKDLSRAMYFNKSLQLYLVYDKNSMLG